MSMKKKKTLLTSYEDALKLGKLFCDGLINSMSDKELLKSLGLKPSKGGWDGYWYCEERLKSYLVITDTKKWMLGKIKYGI